MNIRSMIAATAAFLVAAVALTGCVQESYQLKDFTISPAVSSDDQHYQGTIQGVLMVDGAAAETITIDIEGYIFDLDSEVSSDDIEAVFGTALNEGRMPVVQVVPSGWSKYRIDPDVSGWYASGISAADAYQLQQEKECWEASELSFQNPPPQQAPAGADQPEPSSSTQTCSQGESRPPADIIFDYSFNCSVVEVKIVDWPGFAANLNALLGTQTVQFIAEAPDAQTVQTLEPCGFTAMEASGKPIGDDIVPSD